KVPTVISTFVLNRNGRNANRSRALTLSIVVESTFRSGSFATADDVRWLAMPCAKPLATATDVASVPGSNGPCALSQSLYDTVNVKPSMLTVSCWKEIVGGSVTVNAGGVYWNGGGANTSSGGVPARGMVA